MTDDLSYDMSYEAPAPDGTPAAPASAPVTKPETVYSVKESVFALIFSFAGYFFIKLFLFSDAGIASAVYMVCLAAAAAVFARMSGAKTSGFTRAYFITAVIFSVNIGITDNGLIQFLDLIFAAAMLAMWAFALNNPSYKGADDSLIYCLFDALFGKSFGNIGRCPAAAVSLTKKSRFGANFRNALIGVIIAVPVTVIVAAVLSSADDAFNSIMSGIANVIVDNFLAGTLKYFFGLPLSFLIFGIVYGGIKTEGEKINLYAWSRSTAAMKVAPTVMMCASAVPLCIIYVIFFFSQLSYFTSAFRGVLPEAFSAAEYARKGFFELCAVSVINLFVIIALNLFCRYNDGENGGKKRPAALDFFTVLLSVFTLILIATAQSKMVMYIARFGLTRLRVYTSWFMIVLSVLFVLIIIRRFRAFNMAKTGTVIFTAMLALLSFAQTDALIAEYNISAYKSGYIQSVDFSELSADAVYAAAPLLDSSDELLRTRAEAFMQNCCNSGRYSKWYEKSLSELISESYQSGQE